jgi:hypothetical protein
LTDKKEEQVQLQLQYEQKLKISSNVSTQSCILLGGQPVGADKVLRP